MNPTTDAKQQQQQEAQAVQEELTALRERVRPRPDGDSQEDSSMHNLGLNLPPSKEVLGKINMDSNLHLFVLTQRLCLFLKSSWGIGNSGKWKKKKTHKRFNWGALVSQTVRKKVIFFNIFEVSKVLFSSDLNVYDRQLKGSVEMT